MSQSRKVGVACVFMAMMMLLSGLAMTAGAISVQGTTNGTQSASPSLPAVPSAPLGATADAGDGRIWIWWEHPASQGTELIKWYDVFRGTSPDEIDPASITTMPAGVNFYEDSDVTNGVTYYYQIAAYSDAGTGPRCSVFSGTPTATGALPGAPQNVVAENHVYSARLSWTAPVSSGDAPVRYYTIYRGPTPYMMWSLDTVDGSTFEYVDDTAYPGFDYSYAVTAETVIGVGPESSDSTIHVGGTGTIPSAPESLWSIPFDGMAMLSWYMPTNPSTGGVERFDIFRGTASGGEGATPIASLPRNYDGSYWMTFHLDETVTNDVMYWYTVKAVGSGGSSPASNEVFAVPSKIGVQPAAPYMAAAYVGNGQVLLNFVAATYSPGYVVNVTAIKVYRSTAPGATGELIATLQPGETYYWDNTTTNGVTYYYSTQAVYGAGTSEMSEQLAATPSSAGPAPAAPDNLFANPHGTSVILDVNVGSIPTIPILGYEIYRGSSAGGAKSLIATVEDYFLDGDLMWSDTTATTYATYYYEVKAIGLYGTSGPSNEAHSFPIYTGDAPDAPTGLSGSASGTTAHLTWTFPDYLGTANFIYFDVYADYDGSGVWDYIGGMNGYPGDSPTFDDIYLDPGTYYYKVLAGNYYGESSFSNVVSVTVSGGTPPGAPTDLIAYPGNGHASIDWTAPADIGSAPIDYYIVYKDGVDISHPTSPTDWIGGLTNGVTYSFTVAAHNAAGTGPQSSPILVTPRTTPGAPTGLIATHGNTEALLSWEAPSDTGGVPIEYYVVYQNGMDVAHINGLTTTISDLVNGVQYSFTVAAHNAAGNGPQSTAALVTPSTAPGAPIDLNGSPGNGQVALSWNPPLDNGGLPIDYYIVYQDSVALPEQYTGLTATIINLQNGVMYGFNVMAHNADGFGPLSDGVGFVPRTVPDAPVLVAEPGNGAAALSWTEPANGGAVIDYYTVFQDGVPIPTHYTGLTAVIMGLTNGVQYSFTVAAHNVAGTGPQSLAAIVTPFEPLPPTAPRNLAAAAGNAYVQLTWEAPTSEGTSQLTGYAVFRGASPSEIGYLVDTVGPTVLAYNDTSVANGQTYYYQVKAMNSVGGSPMSNTVTGNPVGPMPPSAPRNANGFGAPTYAVLNWSAPSSEGTTPILSYQIFRGLGTSIMGMVGEVEAGVLTFNDTTVSNNTDYYYKIRAVNSIGTGEFSDVVHISTAEPQAPSAPRNLNAHAGNGYVKLEWDVPTSQGSSPILSYAVFRGFATGNTTQIGQVNSPATEYNDTTVVNGATYYYLVKAVNAVGSSPASNTVQANPAGPAVPGAPGNLAAVGAVGQVNLTWSAASSQTPLTGYQIFRGLSEETIGTTPIATVSGTILAYADVSVTAGTAYYYKVKATNAAGTGPASESAHATPTATAPGQPQNVSATPGPGKVTVSWTAPSTTGGSPITGYKVYRQLAGGSELLSTLGASTLSYQDTTGTAGTTYTYYVVAVNAIGSGSASTSASAAPQSATSADNTMLYVGIAVLIIVVVAVVFLLMRKKK